MAEFPIYTTERSLPGTGPAAYGRLDADTGAGMVARAVGQAGGALADVGMSIYRTQGEAELAEKMAEASGKVSEMHLRFESNLDETTYQEDFDQTFGDIEATEFNNGWARREWNLRLPAIRQRQQELVTEAYNQRIRWKWDQAYTNEKAKAIETGNLGNFNALLQSGRNKGFFTQDFVESERRTARRLSQRRAVAALAANDPDAVLALDTWDKMHAKNPWLIPEDYEYLVGLARAQKSRTMYGQQILAQQQLERIYAAARDMDPQEFRVRIEQSDALSETQKLEAMKVYQSAAKVWDREQVNPFRSTQNYGALLDSLRKVRHGELVGSDELMAQWLKGGRPNYSYNDWRLVDTLRVRLNGEYDEDPDPLVTQYVDTVIDGWLDEKGETDAPQELVGELVKLQQAIEQHRNDPNALDKAVAPVVDKAKEKKARRVLWGYAAMKKGLGYWWQPQTMLKDILTGRYMMVEEEGLPRPKTQTEYDELPKGTRYIDPEGNERVKG